MVDALFARGAGLVNADLQALKRLLEWRESPSSLDRRHHVKRLGIR